MVSLLTQYKSVRAESEKMCKPLKTEDYVPQPADFVNPPKWNLGHTTWYFEEFILQAYFSGYKVFHPGFTFIFNSNSQSDEHGIRRSQRGNLSRPTVEEVFEYRKHVDRAMEKFLKKSPDDDTLLHLIEYGINHEQQHQEMFYSDLKYTFSLNPLIPKYHRKVFVEDKEIGRTKWIKITGGVYSIGHKGEEFCYDNELGRHKVYLHPFEIRSSLVSNAEYLEFIEDNGYKRDEFWHAEGWAWLVENHIKHPMYWFKKDNKWYQFTLAGLRPLNPLNPVSHVSYYEAAAFAKWKGHRLPTEFEWETACEQFEYGQRWEWTESAYLPYPGYKKSETGLEAYDGKHMLNRMVLRGGSVVSAVNHIRKTYRHFSAPGEGWQFNGIRIAR